MKMKKNFMRICAIALMVCMITTFIPVTKVAAAEDTLQANMEYLVNECGQRLYGSPNEDKAAAYVEKKFKEYGYTDVEWAKIDQRSVNYVGRVSFKDGAADVLGNAYPSNPSKGEFDKITGKLVNLGEYGSYALPQNTTGDIVGAICFNNSSDITAANVDAVVTALNEQGVNVKGLLITIKGSYKSRDISKNALETASVPCVVTTEMFFNKAVDNAADFDGMERYTKTQTNAVIATKPAATEDPDAIIIVTSHLDSVLVSPGANDNATGIASNLEIAKNLANKDLGNIEVRFAVVGAEEGGGMLGSVYVRDSLSAEEKAIAMNINMDMLGPGDAAEYGGTLLDAVSMDIINYDENGNKLKSLAFNLPAYLVTDEAKSVTWAPGKNNVRIYRYGSSDHERFAEVGIDASSMIVVVDATDDIEAINHTSKDNLNDNYSRDCHVMCTTLIQNGILKAAEQSVTKKAKFVFTERESDIKATLANAEQLFKTYEKVTAVFTGKDGVSQEFTFTKNQTSVTSLPVGEEYTVTDVKGHGTGTADNNNVERNEELKNFTTDLVSVVTIGDDPEIIPTPDVDEDIDEDIDEDQTQDQTNEQNAVKDEAVKTSDDTVLLPWIIMATMSAMIGAVLVFGRRRNTIR